MGVKERILAIRLLDKIKDDPQRAQKLGIEGVVVQVCVKRS